MGDRIVEVNGVNVESEDIDDVVRRIGANESEVRLLDADQAPSKTLATITVIATSSHRQTQVDNAAAAAGESFA